LGDDFSEYNAEVGMWLLITSTFFRKLFNERFETSKIFATRDPQDPESRGSRIPFRTAERQHVEKTKDLI
jgi:hypothetical protein